MGSLIAHGGPNHTAVAAAIPKTEEVECNNALFGDSLKAKRRKFIRVEDPSKYGTKVHPRQNDASSSSSKIHQSTGPRFVFASRLKALTKSDRLFWTPDRRILPDIEIH